MGHMDDFKAIVEADGAGKIIELGEWLLFVEGGDRFWIDAGEITPELVEALKVADDWYDDMCDATRVIYDGDVGAAVVAAARDYPGVPSLGGIANVW